MTKTILGKLAADAFGMLELPVLPPGILDGFRALPDLTGTVSDAMDELGIVGAVPAALLRPERSDSALVGRALIVRNVAARPRRCRTKSRPASPVSARSRRIISPSRATFWCCRASIWCPISAACRRPSDTARASSARLSTAACATSIIRAPSAMPIWSTSVSPITGKWRVETVGDQSSRSTICGITVNPGDVVLADETGVCFIPRARAAEVLQRAQRNAAAEKLREDKIAAGAPIAELMLRKAK